MVNLAPKTCFYIIFFILKSSNTLAKSYLHTNEVVEPEDDRFLDLPQCTDNSICGYLQANSHGINTQRRCACPRGSSCPMKWDTADGHSVLQGSDQYKFCGTAPTLPICEASVTAYTSRVVYSKETDDIVMKSDHIHCVCPESHNHVLANQKFEDPDEFTEVMELYYICSPLLECVQGDLCKVVSQTATEFLVNRKCVCPEGLRCPTDTQIGKKTQSMGKGIIHYIRCQH